MGIAAVEVALAALTAWLVFRTGFAQHASTSLSLGAVDVFILCAMLACLGVLLFVLAFWQWRLSGRARIRLSLCSFVSLVWCFCGLCWYDSLLARAKLPNPPLKSEQIKTQTLAAVVVMGALVCGVMCVVVILRLDRARERRAKEGEAN